MGRTGHHDQREAGSFDGGGGSHGNKNNANTGIMSRALQIGSQMINGSGNDGMKICDLGVSRDSSRPGSVLEMGSVTSPPPRTLGKWENE